MTTLNVFTLHGSFSLFLTNQANRLFLQLIWLPVMPPQPCETLSHGAFGRTAKKKKMQLA
jgi:hypothetical protein